MSNEKEEAKNQLEEFLQEMDTGEYPNNRQIADNYGLALKHGYIETANLIEQKAIIIDSFPDKLKPLCRAMLIPNLVTFKKFLTSKINVNEENNEGKTLLHILADNYFSNKHETLGIYENLKRTGAQLNKVDSFNKTAFEYAKENNNKTLIDLLNRDLFGQQIPKTKIFFNAIVNDNYDLVKVLLDKDLSLLNSYCDYKGRIISDFKVYKSNPKLNESGDKILKQGIAIDIIQDKNNLYSPLHYAVKFNKINIVKLLVEHGHNINPNKEIEKGRLTPLHTALFFGHDEIANYLIENGADPFIKNDYDFTPLDLAFFLRKVDATSMIRKYIEFGYDVNKTFKSCSFKPIHLILLLPKSENLNMLKTLLGYDIDINAKCKSGLNALHYAVYSLPMFLSERGKPFVDVFNQTDIIKLLVENGININEPNNEGITPLIAAMEFKIIKYSKVLLELGADINVRIKKYNNCTLLHIAAQNNLIELIEYFIKKGISIDEEDDNKATPLVYAIANNNYEAVKYLLNLGASTKFSFEGINLLEIATMVDELDARIIALLSENSIDTTKIGKF